MAQPPDTVLLLSIIGLPPKSARGVKQKLTPISAASQLRRDVNLTLHNLAPQQTQKYSTNIVFDDTNAPSFDGIWPGQEVVIQCIEELSYPTGGVPQRAVVDGSERVDGDTTFYRPILRMMITAWDLGGMDEWEARSPASLDAEEI